MQPQQQFLNLESLVQLLMCLIVSLNFFLQLGLVCCEILQELRVLFRHVLLYAMPFYAILFDSTLLILKSILLYPIL